jgi:hypothetical protein
MKKPVQGKVIRLSSCEDDGDSQMLQIPTQKKIKVILKHGGLSYTADYAALLYRAYKAKRILILNEHVPLFCYVCDYQDVVTNEYLKTVNAVLLGYYIQGIQFAIMLSLEGLI